MHTSLPFRSLCVFFGMYMTIAGSTTTLNNPNLHDHLNSPTTQNQTIKIGVLTSHDISNDRISRDAYQSMTMAVNKVNQNGGINGQKVEIILRTCNGKWGVGSKQAVQLIYEENVCAIIGALDGKNAHLAEQVATKAQVVFISTNATDPSLSRAFVPWYFRIVPDDQQQADRLIREIYKKKHKRQVCIISSSSYDDKMAAQSFVKQISQQGYQAPSHYSFDIRKPDFHQITEQMVQGSFDAIAYFGDGSHIEPVINAMKNKDLNVPIFGHLSTLRSVAHQKLADLFFGYSLNIICPVEWQEEQLVNFRNQFVNMYNYEPGITAAYSYDGINVLLETISKTGTDKHKIQQYLSTTVHMDGVTGQLEFKSNGNRKGNIRICH